MIRVLDDRVLVKCDPKVEKTKGGIFIPTQAQKEQIEGEVVSLGEGKLKRDGTRVAFTVNVGDRVMFDKFSGQELFVDGHRHISIPESDIYGVFES